MEFRLLTQQEIEVLRYLAQRGAYALPIVLPVKMRGTAVALWRMKLVEVWFRAIPHDEPQAPASYFTLSVGGWRRVQPFLSSRRAAAAARSSLVSERA